MRNKNVWTIEIPQPSHSVTVYCNTKKDMIKHVNTLVCAGYNETFESQTIDRYHQSWEKDGKAIVITKHFVDNSISAYI